MKSIKITYFVVNCVKVAISLFKMNQENQDGKGSTCTLMYNLRNTGTAHTDSYI